MKRETENPAVNFCGGCVYNNLVEHVARQMAYAEEHICCIAQLPHGSSHEFEDARFFSIDKTVALSIVVGAQFLSERCRTSASELALMQRCSSHSHFSYIGTVSLAPVCRLPVQSSVPRQLLQVALTACVFLHHCDAMSVASFHVGIAT